MAVGTSESAVARDVAARTVAVSNFPASWLPSGALAANVGRLLEKFGSLAEPPVVISRPCKLVSGDSRVVAYATFKDQDAALRAIKCLHGSDNRTGDEERHANYAPPSEREKYYVEFAETTPSKVLAECGSDERPLKAARAEATPHFLRVGMPRLPAEVPPLEKLSVILQKQLLILAQCELPGPYREDLRPVLLPPRPSVTTEEQRPTLVLDLDGTLVECRHWTLPPLEAEGMMNPITVQLDGKAHLVYFRPKAQVFLATVAQLFEVVVFTASIQCYADQVLDHMDPEGKWISKRLYRQHCTPVPCGPGQIIFLKDMSILGRPVERVILVDDSPISHMMSPDNGIVVSPWTADQTSDVEISALLILLREIHRCVSETGSATEHLIERYGLRAFFDSLRSGAMLRVFLDYMASGSQPPSQGAQTTSKASAAAAAVATPARSDDAAAARSAAGTGWQVSHGKSEDA